MLKLIDRNLQCFRNGQKEQCEGYVGYFLQFRSASSMDFIAKYEFGIVSKTGNVSHRGQIEQTGKGFKEGGWGLPKFISHADLYSDPDLVNDNEITLLGFQSALRRGV